MDSLPTQLNVICYIKLFNSLKSEQSNIKFIFIRTAWSLGFTVAALISEIHDQ